MDAPLCRASGSANDMDWGETIIGGKRKPGVAKEARPGLRTSIFS
jgi:hypothetical protein